MCKGQTALGTEMNRSRSVKNQEGTRKRLGLKWTELERGGNCLGNRMVDASI